MKSINLIHSPQENIFNNLSVYNTNKLVLCKDQLFNKHIHYGYHYSEIEYLESTGTQYIITNVYGSMNLDFYVEFEPLELSNENKKGKGTIFGSRTDWNNTVYQLTTFNKDTTNKGHFICTSNYGYSDSKCPTANLSLNNKNILKKEGLTFTRADGTTFTLTSQTFTTQGPIAIFGYNYQNNLNIAELSKIKLYKLQFSENNVLVHDFIPVRIKNTGYLYDRVTNKLFGNSGTGEFVLGSDLYDFEIEYLESTGTQYIDTGYKHNQDTRFVSKIEFINYSQWQYNFGSYGSTTTAVQSIDNRRLFCIEIDSTLKLATYYISNNKHTFTSISPLGIHIFDLNKNVHTIDNTTYTFTYKTGSSLYNTILFAVTDYNNNIQINSNQKVRIYYFKIFDNGTLIMDLIPVVKNGIGYMYDKINRKLFGNSGTGEFVLGPKLPYDREVEYLESKKNTSYINTGIIINSADYSIISEATFLENNSSLCAVRWAQAPTTDTFGLYIGTAHTFTCFYGRFQNNSYQQITNISNYYGQKLVFKINVNSKFIIEDIEGNVLQSKDITIDSTLSANRFPLFLYGFNNDGNADKGTIGRLRIYSFIIKKENTIIRHFIPVRKGNTGYLYDKITKKLYKNNGLGKFNYGPDLY